MSQNIMEYAFIIVVTLLLSPLVLFLASSQKKEMKAKLKAVYKAILLAVCLIGFFNWESFDTGGRSGFELAISYPYYFLWLFFMILIIQLLLFINDNREYHIVVVVLNFVNTIILLLSLIGLSKYLGKQVVSLYTITAVFLLLIGNILGLVFINKDKNVLRKYWVT